MVNTYFQIGFLATGKVDWRRDMWQNHGILPQMPIRWGFGLIRWRTACCIVSHSRRVATSWFIILSFITSSLVITTRATLLAHDDVIKWKHFPRHWTFVRGFHRPRWIPKTKASDTKLWCFFYLRLNKRLSKQPWGWWFEMLSWSLWRHCYGHAITHGMTQSTRHFAWFVWSEIVLENSLIRFSESFMNM